jgi:hypothetical protein
LVFLPAKLNHVGASFRKSFRLPRFVVKREATVRVGKREGAREKDWDSACAMNRQLTSAA